MRRAPTLAIVPASDDRIIRRVFDNAQLIEKFDKYLMVVKKSPHTRERYACWVRQFGEFLGDKNFATVKSLDVSAFLGTLLDRGLQKATVASALYGLRSFYRFLQLGDQVLICVPYKIAVTKIAKRLPHALSVAEVKQIIRAADTPRDLALLELAFASGLRVSELADLRIEEVNLRARTLMVRDGKWGRDRLALFGRPAAAALRAYLGDRTKGFVFQPECRPLPAELKLTRRSILRVFVKVAARAEIGKRVGVHTFRHSFATACLNGGMDIRHIQALMGHTTLHYTQKYLHISMDRLKKTHTKFLRRG